MEANSDLVMTAKRGRRDASVATRIGSTLANWERDAAGELVDWCSGMEWSPEGPIRLFGGPASSLSHRPHEKGILGCRREDGQRRDRNGCHEAGGQDKSPGVEFNEW